MSVYLPKGYLSVASIVEALANSKVMFIERNRLHEIPNDKLVNSKLEILEEAFAGGKAKEEPSRILIEMEQENLRQACHAKALVGVVLTDTGVKGRKGPIPYYVWGEDDVSEIFRTGRVSFPTRALTMIEGRVLFRTEDVLRRLELELSKKQIEKTSANETVSDGLRTVTPTSPAPAARDALAASRGRKKPKSKKMPSVKGGRKLKGRRDVDECFNWLLKYQFDNDLDRFTNCADGEFIRHYMNYFDHSDRKHLLQEKRYADSKNKRTGVPTSPGGIISRREKFANQRRLDRDLEA